MVCASVSTWHCQVEIDTALSQSLGDKCGHMKQMNLLRQLESGIRPLETLLESEREKISRLEIEQNENSE